MPDVLLFAWDVSAAEFRPWSYVKVLRDLLAQHMPQCADVAMSYTLHSCKATYLSYMSQCNLGRTDRRLQGHHRSGAVELYARDDTFGALRAQREVLRRIRCGWLPATPIARGGRAPMPTEPVSLAAMLGPPATLCHMFQYFGAFQAAAQEEVSASEQAENGDLAHVRAKLRECNPVAEESDVLDGGVTGIVAPAVPVLVDDAQVREPVPYECVLESASEAEDHDELGEPEEVLWVRSGKGVFHVAVGEPGQAGGLPSRAACGAWLRDPILIRAPDACSTFCRRRGCLLRAAGTVGSA